MDKKKGKAGIGEIHWNCLFMCEVGPEVKDKNGKVTHIFGAAMGGGPMTIMSCKTSKWFAIGHDELLKIAIAAGIDEEDVAP